MSSIEECQLPGCNKPTPAMVRTRNSSWGSTWIRTNTRNSLHNRYEQPSKHVCRACEWSGDKLLDKKTGERRARV